MRRRSSAFEKCRAISGCQSETLLSHQSRETFLNPQYCTPSQLPWISVYKAELGLRSSAKRWRHSCCSPSTFKHSALSECHFPLAQPPLRCVRKATRRAMFDLPTDPEIELALTARFPRYGSLNSRKVNSRANWADESVARARLTQVGLVQYCKAERRTSRYTKPQQSSTPELQLATCYHVVACFGVD